jgi:histidyl-tRNA synthetase
VAQHIGELGTPFKRYHIATVWRGENTQRGRFREFMQCDFDTIGTLSPVADAETVLVVNDLLEATGFERFTIRVNNRLVLNGLLEAIGLSEKSTEVLRALDKLPKAGPRAVAGEIEATAGATSEQANRVLALANLSGGNEQVISQLRPLVAESDTGQMGVGQLADLLATVTAAGLPERRVALDVAIARGLDYYTGLVLETTLDDCAIGSVASGGRYDNLAELYTNQQLPGVGASLGLDRLLDAMADLKMLAPVRTPADVFIPYFEAARIGDYFRLAAVVRAAGVGVEVFPECKKLAKQLQYADRRGFRMALVIGEQEFAAQQCQVKDLASGGSKTVSLANEASEVVSEIRRALALATA